MVTKSRQAISGGRIIGAKIRAEGARKRAAEAAPEADRAEAEAWSIQTEAYGGPAQPSPTSIAGMAVAAQIPPLRYASQLPAIRRPRQRSISKFEAATTTPRRLEVLND